MYDNYRIRDTNLEIYESCYAPLFQDCVAIGDRTKARIDCQNNNDPTNEEYNEGNEDSDGIDLGEQNEHLFPANSSKRKKSNTVTLTRSTKGKSSGSSRWVDKLDGVIEAISARSTQSFPPKYSSPTTQECMDIVTCFPEFEEGSRMYCRALRIFLKKQIRENFMVPKNHAAKMEFLKMESDSDSSEDNEQNMIEEENRWLLSCALAVKVIIIGHILTNTRRPCRTSCRTGNIFIQEVLNGHPRRCYEDFRLNVPAFRKLCSDLVTHYGLKPTLHISVEESVGMFLFTLAHGCGKRLTQETFNHSGETVIRHFHTVLTVVLKLSDCIGAIDGTHMKATVHEHEQAKYIGRKGNASQNIMVVCDFNMCFMFAWAGWEGSCT
ncbi:LOW QUALITY PROTEIN: hypothetical protein OSB04_011003 [Centaurea solstitialis]|uniref:DUF8040 domain-containing protein n=1 Tax=Centaurea solstitialis TaxID=347529 RepID=A0AA38TAB7_9ASTR|nr:LOW QUALITY PROTEIN: hypothetical protein OSB04_011003 [Centaurea solstitialis]